jgi:hypothetical protein
MDINKAFTMYILSIFSDPDTPVLISSFKKMEELRLFVLNIFVEDSLVPKIDFMTFINRYDNGHIVKSEKLDCTICLDDDEETVRYYEDGKEIIFEGDDGMDQKVKE